MSVEAHVCFFFCFIFCIFLFIYLFYYCFYSGDFKYFDWIPLASLICLPFNFFVYPKLLRIVILWGKKTNISLTSEIFLKRGGKGGRRDRPDELFGGKSRAKNKAKNEKNKKTRERRAKERDPPLAPLKRFLYYPLNTN